MKNIAFIFAWLLAAVVRLPAQSLIQTNPVSSIEVTKLSGGGSLGTRALANQVNNPTAPVSLVQFRDIFAPRVPGYDNPANVFQIQPCFPIFGKGVIPFDQLMKWTVPFPTTPEPGSQTGLGDISVFDVITLNQSWGKWGFGPSLTFPTATATALGQGKWQAGPAVAVIFTDVKDLQIGAVFQDSISYAGAPDRPSVNLLSVTPTLTYNLAHGWFAGYNDLDWTFDWKHGGAATIPVGPQAGKVFTLGKVPVSLSLEGAWFPARAAGNPEWLVCLEFTVIFKTLRAPH